MADPEWSAARRIGFRFAFVLGACFVYPFPLGYLPKTDWLAQYASKPIEWLVTWFGGSLLGWTEVAFDPDTGSGDTAYQFCSWIVFAILAALIAVAWSILDRRRRAYPQLAAAAWQVLRYVLAFAMLTYGLVKVIPAQMPPPSYVVLDERVGEMSPMGMLWTFMGSAPHYELFGGLCECLGGVLLLSRRTVTLGALVSAGVLVNVVVLNFTYDVPVKLYSSMLLASALVVASPQLGRVLTAVLGGAVAAVPPRPRGTIGRERARLIAKVGLLLAVGVTLAAQVHDSYVGNRGEANGLEGAYAVESASDPQWTRVAIASRFLTVRHPDDTRAFFRFAEPPAHDTFTLADGQTGKMLGPFHVTRPDAQHLAIDGPVKLLLRRAPEPLLVTRGFHLIQEYPFNR